MQLPSLFPIFVYRSGSLYDGSVVPVCSFCRNAFAKGNECKKHYEAIARKPPGYYQCPFGFTTRSFAALGNQYAVTGVVAHPRFDSKDERSRAKLHPDTRVSRDSIERMLAFFAQFETVRADAVQSATKVLPQAFHELRKLNGAILQHAEKELKTYSSPALLTIKSAAELMRNNFDILEALSNIEGMRALPLDDTINLYDLVYKMKKVYDERAESKRMHIDVKGVRAIVPGSQKSFPIVPAVLIENAIKYGKPGGTVFAEVATVAKRAILTVENESQYQIDDEKCFERGTRYADEAAEGGGFGLFLAREVVAAHQGAIRCDAGSGRVRFIVDLPLERVIAQGW